MNPTNGKHSNNGLSRSELQLFVHLLTDLLSSDENKSNVQSLLKASRELILSNTNTEEMNIIHISSQEGSNEVMELLITSDSVNIRDKSQKLPINYAFDRLKDLIDKRMFYPDKIPLIKNLLVCIKTLLNNDSMFPEEFIPWFESLKKNEGSLESTLFFNQIRDIHIIIEERKQLHEYIHIYDESRINDLLSRIGQNMIFYFDESNKSALSASLDSRYYSKCYLFLKSKGLHLYKDELNRVWNIDFKKRADLKDSLLDNLSTKDNYINSLKFRTIAIGKDAVEEVNKAYSRISSIYELEPIIRTVAISEISRVIVDLSDPRSSVELTFVPLEKDDMTKNSCYYDPLKNEIFVFNTKEGRKKALEELIIHKLTHAALNLIYKNGGFPFHKGEKEADDTFGRFVTHILSSKKMMNFS